MSGPLPSGFKIGRWLCASRIANEITKSAALKASTANAYCFQPILAGSRCPSSLSRASGIGVDPLADSLGGRIEDAGHPPAQRNRAGDRQPDGPERMQQRQIQWTISRSMTRLEFLGPDHHVTEIDQGGHGQHAGQVEHESPWFQRWSQATTSAKNRPKKARPRASVARDIMSVRPRIQIRLAASGPAGEPVAEDAERAACFLFLQESAADRGARGLRSTGDRGRSGRGARLPPR